MRATLFSWLAVLPLSAALPYASSDQRLAVRDNLHQPRYEVVPLEPEEGGGDEEESPAENDNKDKNNNRNKDSDSDDDKDSTNGSSGGNDRGNANGEDDEEPSTIVKTIVQTHKVQEQVTVTASGKGTVTRVKTIPTTIVSVVDLEGDVTTVTVDGDPVTTTTTTTAPGSVITKFIKTPTKAEKAPPKKGSPNEETPSKAKTSSTFSTSTVSGSSTSMEISTSTDTAGAVATSAAPELADGSASEESGANDGSWNPNVPGKGAAHNGEGSREFQSGFWTKTTSTATESTTTRPVDDGQWHTTYRSAGRP